MDEEDEGTVKKDDESGKGAMEKSGLQRREAWVDCELSPGKVRWIRVG